eukprot:CAMPEP_0203718058 /NCGR_PEP_ID=MMETSP0092-20131115/2434_1 /ASSEMBLY_ACC=CAM_ASM_001090 /TAXON_ID=426623 /ORGANISM="Chaetoceros affinis, Strain CCMP159" /LENGTH=112 /DNA_ID=CAMNT_0050597089 /DNA_START=632 /DNA_END=970 /DNA_ORIENTATION=-
MTRFETFQSVVSAAIQRSSRSRRKPVCFSDEYAKYYVNVPVVVVAAAAVDIVSRRCSSRSRRNPVCFSDEYAKYYVNIPVVVAAVDIVPRRCSLRSKRKPVCFSDEYTNYYF